MDQVEQQRYSTYESVIQMHIMIEKRNEAMAIFKSTFEYADCTYQIIIFKAQITRLLYLANKPSISNDLQLTTMALILKLNVQQADLILKNL